MSIDWASVDIKNLKLDDFGKRKVSDLCHQFGLLDNFLIQVVLLTVMVHQLAIIYNAERAIDIAKITNKCNGAPATDVIAQCNIAVAAARVGFGFTTLLLIMVRYIDSWTTKSGAIAKVVFGVVLLITFIITLACASIARGKTTECIATQPPNQVGNPLEELKSVLGNMVNWSAVGMTASLLFSIFYIYRAVTGSTSSAGELLEAASSAAGEATGRSSLESSGASTPASP